MRRYFINESTMDGDGGDEAGQSAIPMHDNWVEGRGKIKSPPSPKGDRGGCERSEAFACSSRGKISGHPPNFQSSENAAASPHPGEGFGKIYR